MRERHGERVLLRDLCGSRGSGESQSQMGDRLRGTLIGDRLRNLSGSGLLFKFKTSIHTSCVGEEAAEEEARSGSTSSNCESTKRPNVNAG